MIVNYILFHSSGGNLLLQEGHYNFTSIQLFRQDIWNIWLQGVTITFDGTSVFYISSDNPEAEVTKVKHMAHSCFWR